MVTLSLTDATVKQMVRIVFQYARLYGQYQYKALSDVIS